MSSNVPQLRFPEFEEEWSAKTLDQLTTRIGDGIHSTPKYNDNGNYFFINGNNLVDGKISISESTKKVDENEAKKHGRKLSNKTILLSINGTIGNLASYNDEKVVLGKSAAYINLQDDVNIGFIYNLLKMSKTQNFFFSELTGSTIKNLSLKTIRETNVFIPTLPEQEKIATFLTSVDEKLQALKKKKELLEQYKKGAMQKLFSQELRFKQDDGSASPDWESRRLSEVFIEVNEKVGQRNLETYSITAGQGFVSQKEKFGRDISGQQNAKYTALQVNQFAYNKGNSKKYKYGCVYLNTTGKQIAVPNVFISFKLINNKMSPVFYVKLFENHYLDKGLRQIISSSARMDGLLNVNKKYFFQLKIMVPTPPEQEKIADFLSSIDESIENVGKQIEASQEWKMGLLQKMFV